MKKHNIVPRVRHLTGPIGLTGLLLLAVVGCGSSGGSSQTDSGIGISHIAPAANDATTFSTPFDATPDADGKNIFFTALTLDGTPAVWQVAAAGGPATMLA